MPDRAIVKRLENMMLPFTCAILNNLYVCHYIKPSLLHTLTNSGVDTQELSIKLAIF